MWIPLAKKKMDVDSGEIYLSERILKTCNEIQLKKVIGIWTYELHYTVIL